MTLNIGKNTLDLDTMELENVSGTPPVSLSPDHPPLRSSWLSTTLTTFQKTQSSQAAKVS